MCGCSTVIGVAKSVGFIMREHARVNEGARERDSSVRLFKDFECILRRNFPTWQPNLQSNNPHRCIPLFIKGAAGECVYTQMYVYLFLEYIVNIYIRMHQFMCGRTYRHCWRCCDAYRFVYVY